MKSGKNTDIKNAGASVRARLFNIAKQSNRDYNALLVQYVQERFLYRLSRSPYKAHFILKGALLLLPYQIQLSRPTKDIDFLGLAISNDLKSLKLVLQEITAIKETDGVEFTPSTITIERITEQSDYQGVRAGINGNIGGARFSLQVDIGFGDTIIPGPVEVEYPVLLDDPVPHLQVYSLESAIAEKFEAIVKLNFLTSRMKDFYDIYFLASQHSFESRTLHSALISTFKNRGTNIEDMDQIFGDRYPNDERMNKMWLAFLKRQKITTNNSFAEIVDRLAGFIKPIFIDENISRKWNIQKWQWIRRV